MSLYQALYRKWRPKTFDDVAGQGHITETLKNQVRTGRFSHAYLFTGTRGTGKTTCAKILAKAVNCESPVDGNPCNACRFCRGIDDGSILDVVEMDAASNNGVDNVRQLRDEAVFSPATANMRVYIIDEVHMLSVSAFNALLKILEEPPSHLLFILATTELNKVPATILSRCQRHSFKRLDVETIVARLDYVAKEEKLGLTPGAATLIAGLSEGGMRDALSILDQCSGREKIDTDTVYSAMGLAGNRQTGELLRHIANHDTASALTLFTRLWRDGKNPATVLGELSNLQRDLLLRSVAPRGGRELLSGGYDEALLASFDGAFSTAALAANIDLLLHAMNDLRTGQARTVSELTLVTLCEPGLNDSAPMLRARIAALEDELARGTVLPGPVNEVDITQNIASEQPTPEEVPPFDLDETPPFQEDVPPFDFGALPPPSPEDAASFYFELPSPPPLGEPEREVDITSQPTAALESAADGESGALWEQIKAGAKKTLPIGIYSILADLAQTGAEVENDTLILYLKSGFARNMIDRPDVTGKLALIAAEAAGRPLHIKVAESGGSAPSAGTGKLDELAKYPIVKFK